MFAKLLESTPAAPSGCVLPKKADITSEQIEWIRKVHEHTRLSHMSSHLGICVDTLKRVMVREGIAQFDAAKYQLPVRHTTQWWNRPCTGCGSTARRAKWTYFCERCKASYERGDI